MDRACLRGRGELLEGSWTKDDGLCASAFGQLPPCTGDCRWLPTCSHAGRVGSLGWIGVDSMGVGGDSWVKGGALSGEGPGLGTYFFSFLGSPGG